MSKDMKRASAITLQDVTELGPLDAVRLQVRPRRGLELTTHTQQECYQLGFQDGLAVAKIQEEHAERDRQTQRQWADRVTMTEVHGLKQQIEQLQELMRAALSHES